MRGRLTVALVVAGSLVACRSGNKALLGTFVGDVDVGGGVLLTRADGPKDFVGRDPAKPGRITIATTDAKTYTMNVESAAMTCALKAHVDADSLVVDCPDARGRSQYVDPDPSEGPPFQVCRLKALGFEGDVNVCGRATAPGTDQLHASLRLYPRAGGSNGTVRDGSLATMSFERGSRHRALER